MEKIKNIFSKHKTEIIIFLGAVISIATAFAALPNANATACSIVIAVVAAIIEALKTGFSEATINLIAKAVLIIIEEINNAADKKAVSASAEFPEDTLTVENIKERLLEE